MQSKNTHQAQIWQEYEKFVKDYELTLKNNKPFHEIVKEIMKDRNLTIEQLVDKSGLATQTVHRLRSGKTKNNKGVEVEYFPYLNTIISFAIACDLDMLMTITLLDSLGYGFRRTYDVHYAYCYLIVNCRGKSISECNEVLEQLGIDEKYQLRDIEK